MESTFTIYDGNYNLIFANRAAYNALPKFYEALEQGRSLQEATERQIEFFAPDFTPSARTAYAEKIVEKLRADEQYEIIGSQDRVYAVRHEKLGENNILGIGLDVSD